MRRLTLGVLLLLTPCGPLRAQVEAPVVGEAHPIATMGAFGAAPAPLALTIPSLSGAPSLTPVVLAPAAIDAAPAPAAAAPVPAAAVANPVPSPAAAAPAAEALPIPAADAALAGAPGAVNGAKATALAAVRSLAAPSIGDGPDAGRAFFDRAGEHAGAAAPAPGGVRGAWSAVKDFFEIGGAVPAWPGKAGAPVRIGRIKTVLTRRIGDGGTATVWMGGDERYAVKILHPQTLDVPGTRDEAEILRAVARTDIPVARLMEVSRDGLVLVKEFIDGDDASKILDQGGFSRPQKEGWAELAAKLIKNGVTADLAGGNLVWQRWRTRWVLVDGGGLTDGGPRQVLTQLLAGDTLARSGLNAGEFLAGLRGRLGPDSAVWMKTLEALREAPALAGPLAELAARDAALPPAPHVIFGPAPQSPAGLDDAVVSAREVVRRLGWNPLRIKNGVDLHSDDPGKLNTRVLLVQTPGKTAVVLKKAEWGVVRNEIALRRLARRFFGHSFRVPAALAVNRGSDSFLVMEKLEANSYHYETILNPEQRVGAALFILTFGVGDVNPGNVLSPRYGGLPWLLDFEQAMGRSSPVAGRIPDEGIVLEMPWLTRKRINRVEDFAPAVRAWRSLLAEPASQKAIEGDLRASGFSAQETARLLALFQANAADLDWTLQNDVDFANQFAARHADRR